jgi:hypothetical protein
MRTTNMCKIATTRTIWERQSYKFTLLTVARFQTTFLILQVRLNAMTLFLFILGRGGIRLFARGTEETAIERLTVQVVLLKQAINVQ